MSKKATPRNIMRIELDDRGKTALNKSADSLGMSQVAMMSRLVQHFVTLKHDAQRAIVDRPPTNGAKAKPAKSKR